MSDEQILAPAENQEVLPTSMVTDEDVTNGVSVRTRICSPASYRVVAPKAPVK